MLGRSCFSLPLAYILFMQQFLLVGLGGGVGAMLRYALGSWVMHHTPGWKFPVGTFVVNVVGCLVAGILTRLIEAFEWFKPDTRLFLFTGILGGFTTFSAFGVETVALIRRGETGVALAYVGMSVVVGLMALWLGMKAVELAGR